MSFWPFPKNLLAELHAGASIGPWVEIGAGDGRLCTRLSQAVRPGLALDLRPALLLGMPRALGGDARALPLLDGSLGACLFADVMRHLRPEDRARAALECARVLRPGGRVLVLEDDPEARDAAEQNYRSVLDLLAAYDPSRGAALAIDRATESMLEHVGVCTLSGVAENEESVVDPLAPLRWMRARTSAENITLGSRLDALEEAVQAHGMRYGRFAFAVFARS